MTNLEKQNSLAHLHNYIRRLLEDAICPYSYAIHGEWVDPNVGSLIDDSFDTIANICEKEGLSEQDALESSKIDNIIKSLISYIESSLFEFFCDQSSGQNILIPGLMQNHQSIKQEFIKATI